MSAQLTIGLVGCGHHAALHVAALLESRGLVRATAVCDLDLERARGCADRLGAERVYTDYDELLADPGIDAVLLCLPHATHSPAAVAAARAGKHILVEKPIARTLDEADAMIDAAEAAGVTLMVAHNQRFFPEHRAVHELVRDGAIGEIFSARADHHMDFRPPEGHFILRRDAAGGGALIGYGVHRIDLLRWFVGEIVQVAGFQLRRPGRFEGETSAAAVFRFENGAIGELAVNWTAIGSPWMDLLYLHGERGSIHNLGGLNLQTADGGVRRIAVDTADPFREQLVHFARCVLDGTTPLTHGRDARRTLEVCTAVYQAAGTGRVVELPLAPEVAAGGTG